MAKDEKDADAKAEAAADSKAAASAKKDAKKDSKDAKKDANDAKKDAKDAKKDSKDAKKAGKKEEPEHEEIPMDAAAIKAYSSVIADAAEDSEPQTPVEYHAVIQEDEHASKHEVMSSDPMGSMI